MSLRSNQSGFSLAEVMIVVAIIAVIASICIPNILSAKQRANEAAAVATLRSIAGAQNACRLSTAIDVNHNGAGEFGFLAELSGHVGVRQGDGGPPAEPIHPRLLSVPKGREVSFLGGTTTVGGAVAKSGYHFAMFLPSATRDFVPEAGAGGGTESHRPDPLQSESFWCCYAWPTSAGASGKRCFFVNERGEILGSENTDPGTRYSGPNRGPAPTAAFLLGAATLTMNSSIAANTSGTDGQLWRVVR